LDILDVLIRDIDDADQFEFDQDERAFAEQEIRRECMLDIAIDNIHGGEQSIPRMLEMIHQAGDGPHILSFYVENRRQRMDLQIPFWPLFVGFTYMQATHITDITRETVPKHMVMATGRGI
jgi:hypothetical protein